MFISLEVFNIFVQNELIIRSYKINDRKYITTEQNCVVVICLLRARKAYFERCFLQN